MSRSVTIIATVARCAAFFKTHRKALFSTVSILVFVGLVSTLCEAATLQSLGTEEWREDVEALGVLIETKHVNPYKFHSEEPFLKRIQEDDVINQDRHLYVITDRVTFSAAVNFVTRMERNTKATFAGEPAAGRPNHFGDAFGHKLPNSKIWLRLSTVYWQDSDPDDERTSIPMDIPVELTYDDYAKSRDPVLEAVLDHQKKTQN